MILVELPIDLFLFTGLLRVGTALIQLTPIIAVKVSSAAFVTLSSAVLDTLPSAVTAHQWPPVMSMLFNGTSIPPEPNSTLSIDIYSFRYWLSGIAGCTVCAIGLLGNAFNIVIQLRMFNKGAYKSSAPITLFLLVMAVCDVLVLLIYITYGLICVARPSRRPLIMPADVEGKEGTFTYFWYHVWYFPANIFMTLSNWCIVAVMCFRFVVVYFPLKAKTMCSLLRARNTVILIFICSIIVTIPDFFTIRIQKSDSKGFEFVDTDLSHNELFTRAYFAILEAFNSFLPFIICAFLSVMLVRTLNRHDVALNQSRNSLKSKQAEVIKRQIGIMLLGVTSWFIFCTFPSFLCRVLTLLRRDDDSHDSRFYPTFRGVADFFLLLNHTANFLLYTATSDIYRTFFMDLLLCRDRKELTRQSTISLMNNASFRTASLTKKRGNAANAQYAAVLQDVEEAAVESDTVLV